MTAPPRSPQEARRAMWPIFRCPPLVLVMMTDYALAAGETTLVSVSQTGQRGDKSSRESALSADGRYVAFISGAGNLVPDDTNNAWDAFVRDRVSGKTTRVSVTSDGQQSEGDTFIGLRVAISANGRYVAFRSSARDLVPQDNNRAADIFVHDRKTGRTERVSVDSSGNEGNANSAWPSISADGRFVAFWSVASNLVPDDTNDRNDVFVHDRVTGRTDRVSVDSAGNQFLRADSMDCAISGNGRYIAFSKGFSNPLLGIPAPPDGGIYLHDRQTRETVLASFDAANNPVFEAGFDPVVSADGRFVVFATGMPLVPSDTNGTTDVYIRDRQGERTILASVDFAGRPTRDGGSRPVISSDGRFVSFLSATVQLYDSTTGRSALVTDELPGPTGFCRNGGVSADGRVVGFECTTNSDTAQKFDTFVRDRLLDRSATADLAVTQTVSPSAFEPLAPVTYTVTAVNHGPDAADEVSLYDSPALRSATVSSATPSQGHCSQGAPLVCYFGALAPGAEATLTLTLQPKWRGTPRLSNTARISAAPVDPLSRNNATTLRIDGAP
ncbi:hypothetical protein ACW73L_00880 [Methylolobus aquaticus]